MRALCGQCQSWMAENALILIRWGYLLSSVCNGQWTSTVAALASLLLFQSSSVLFLLITSGQSDGQQTDRQSNRLEKNQNYYHLRGQFRQAASAASLQINSNSRTVLSCFCLWIKTIPPQNFLASVLAAAAAHQCSLIDHQSVCVCASSSSKVVPHKIWQ